MRAWIETDLKPNVIGLKKVALRVRAWIETKGWYTIPSPTNVALRVRAWIETQPPMALRFHTSSPSA